MKLQASHRNQSFDLNSKSNDWFLYEACNFIKKETLTQVFSYLFCEIFKNTFFKDHLRGAVSESSHGGLSHGI